MIFMMQVDILVCLKLCNSFQHVFGVYIYDVLWPSILKIVVHVNVRKAKQSNQLVSCNHCLCLMYLGNIYL